MIDIYDLECILDDDTITEEINKIQTLAILSGGSIITNVSITSPKPILPTNPAYYLSINSSIKSLQVVVDVENLNNIINFSLNGSNSQLIGSGLGRSLLCNNQITISFGYNNNRGNATTIPFSQVLIEYIAEENSLV